MRTFALALTGCLVTGCLLSGCGGSSSKPQSTAPADTKNNPGPNTTAGDPGPNNTANGPQTLQGSLVARSGCFEVDGNIAKEPKGRFQVQFTSETVQRRGNTVVISGSDGTRTIGSHDVVYLAGRTASGSGPCGKKFVVEKVVAVTPPA